MVYIQFNGFEYTYSIHQNPTYILLISYLWLIIPIHHLQIPLMKYHWLYQTIDYKLYHWLYHTIKNTYNTID